MSRRIAALLLALCMLPWTASALEGAYLPAEALRTLEPSFQAFLDEMADTLIEYALLEPQEREEWILYQLGDYYQNGGFGSIVVMYTPGLLHIADEAVTLRRFVVTTDAGEIHLDTLRRYSQGYSPLPGLPLDVEIFDSQGIPVPCRFHWTATGGSFLTWDSALESVVDVGNPYISDGRPLYWYAKPVEGIDEELVLDILPEDTDEAMASIAIIVTSTEDYWTPEVLP